MRRSASARSAGALLTLLVGGCVSPPRPTVESIRIAANRPAVLEGVVRDRDGRPVAGVSVQALPRGKHVPWSPPARTDAEGRFRLTVAAPAEYGFVLSSGGITVVTPDPADPARLRIPVQPGERRTGAELTFLRDEWRALAGERPPAVVR